MNDIYTCVVVFSFICLLKTYCTLTTSCIPIHPPYVVSIVLSNLADSSNDADKIVLVMSLIG